MTGVVLCGGNSRRMGSDKGLLLYNGNTWAQHTANKLAGLGLPVIYSINAQQEHTYSPDENFIIDNPLLNIGGPLKGILSIHLEYPDEALFVIACDLRDMQPSVIIHLYNAYLKQPVQTTIYSNDGEDEPLCGIYDPVALANVYHLYQQNQLIKHSLKFALEKMPVSRIDVPAEWQSSFTNFNEPV